MNENINVIGQLDHGNKQPNHKGNWKSYFKEFTMLFMAVFCGFLAENYRENMIEKQQEMQYMQSLVEDLKIDVVQIKNALEFRKIKREKMDSLMSMFKDKTIQGHESDLYYFGRMIMRTQYFQSNDRTYSQLKNSGGMRLIKSKKVSDSIMEYHSIIDGLSINESEDGAERYHAMNAISLIFNPYIFNKMVTEIGVQRPIGNPPLRSYDPSIHQDLAHWIHQLIGSDYLIQDKLLLLERKATQLINLINKEYELEYND